MNQILTDGSDHDETVDVLDTRGETIGRIACTVKALATLKEVSRRGGGGGGGRGEDSPKVSVQLGELTLEKAVARGAASVKVEIDMPGEDAKLRCVSGGSNPKLRGRAI